MALQHRCDELDQIVADQNKTISSLQGSSTRSDKTFSQRVIEANQAARAAEPFRSSLDQPQRSSVTKLWENDLIGSLASSQDILYEPKLYPLASLSSSGTFNIRRGEPHDLPYSHSGNAFPQSSTSYDPAAYAASALTSSLYAGAPYSSVLDLPVLVPSKPLPQPPTKQPETITTLNPSQALATPSPVYSSIINREPTYFTSSQAEPVVALRREAVVELSQAVHREVVATEPFPTAEVVPIVSTSHGDEKQTAQAADGTKSTTAIPSPTDAFSAAALAQPALPIVSVNDDELAPVPVPDDYEPVAAPLHIEPVRLSSEPSSSQQVESVDDARAKILARRKPSRFAESVPTESVSLDVSVEKPNVSASPAVVHEEPVESTLEVADRVLMEARARVIARRQQARPEAPSYEAVGLQLSSRSGFDEEEDDDVVLVSSYKDELEVRTYRLSGYLSLTLYFNSLS